MLHIRRSWMRLPRLRWTLRTCLAAIAVIAVAIVFLLRPHPVASFRVDPTLTMVWWSDGSRTQEHDEAPANYRGFGPLLNVQWSNGSSSWYLSRKRLRNTLFGDNAAAWDATLRNDPKSLARAEAASQIGEHADQIEPNLVLPTLITALNDTSPEVRRSVVAALYRFSARSTSAIPALAEATRDEDVLVRIMAIEALGDAPKTEDVKKIAVPALEQALKDSRNLVRCRAAKKLAAWGEGASGVPAMIEILERHGAPETREDDRLSNRRAAIASLAQIGLEAHAAIPALIEAMKDADPEVRVRAASALTAMGQREVATPVLRRALESEDSDIRVLASQALSKLDAEKPAINDKGVQKPPVD